MGAQTYTTLHLDGVNNIFVFMSIPNNQFFISLKSLFDKVLPFLKNSSNSFFGLYLYCTANCSWKHNANQKRQKIAETCLDQRFSYCCFIGKESHPVSPPMAHFAVDFWPTRRNASRLHLVTFRCVPKTPHTKTETTTESRSEHKFYLIMEHNALHADSAMLFLSQKNSYFH